MLTVFILYKRSQVIAETVETKDAHLASAEGLDIFCCYLDFQEISKHTMKKEKPIIDLRV